jgi:hypothetical protein
MSGISVLPDPTPLLRAPSFSSPVKEPELSINSCGSTIIPDSIIIKCNLHVYDVRDWEDVVCGQISPLIHRATDRAEEKNWTVPTKVPIDESV